MPSRLLGTRRNPAFQHFQALVEQSEADMFRNRRLPLNAREKRKSGMLPGKRLTETAFTIGENAEHVFGQCSEILPAPLRHALGKRHQTAGQSVLVRNRLLHGSHHR